ncbi:DUF4398 domain-containing protein [Cellvibrio sp.]|uniref:DUF4398 domain-containing protein n=1 Tax=Cellvibrio sp. TaxID=1965322 RepID=UPI0039647ADD
MMWNIKFNNANTLKTFCAAGTLIFISGCASTPPPDSQITAAETAIKLAEQAQVTDYASPELVEARKYLADARTEISEKNMTRAARFAQRAQLNAELATAKTAAVKAKEVNDELQKGTSVIKQELQRNEGAQ